MKKLANPRPDLAELANRTAKLVLDIVRTDGYDEAARRHSCQATVTLELPETPAMRKALAATLTVSGKDDSAKVIAMLMNEQQSPLDLASSMLTLLGVDPPDLSAIRVNGLKLSADVQYISQATEDNRHYGEAVNLEPLIQTIVTVAALGGFDQPTAPAAAQASIPVVPSTPPAKVDATAVQPVPPECAGMDISTTVGQVDCSARQFEIADKALNAKYKVLMANLDPASANELRNRQREWIANKETECAARGKEFEGGTLQSVVENDCVLELTRARLAELELISTN